MDAQYRLVRPQGDLAMRGLRVLAGGPEAAPGVPLRGKPGDVAEKVQGFLAYAQSVHLDTSRMVVALQKGPGPDGKKREIIAGMGLWVPAPGRTAVVSAPSISEFPQAAEPTELAIAAALEDARAAGIVLVQALMEPSDAAGKTVFSAAGLTRLATLTYMERRPPMLPPQFTMPAGLTLLPYEAATHAFFRMAIADSYQETLDCPALSGLRQVDDVIEGHRAVGVFDPQLWGVLMKENQPVGCLLLAEIPARRGLELVYLGLSPKVRGQGLGRILMQRVLAISSRRHFEVATLAVDAANVPAVRLYRRCGYTSVAQRVAMIRRLS